MWVMLPIVGGAAIAKKMTNKSGRGEGGDASVARRHGEAEENEEEREEEEGEGEERVDDEEGKFLSPSRRRYYQRDHRYRQRGNENTTFENSNDENNETTVPTKKNAKRLPFAEKSINQFLPSINVEEMISTLKKEKFALECELGMMSATLEEETLRADALEEDLNNTRQTLQAVVERDTLSETRKLQDKLALAQDELILLNATVEEEFKKNDELREELKSVQNTLEEVVKRETATVRENEDLLRRSKFEINEELMIQNRKIETLEKEKERLEGMCETYETRIEKAKVEFEETLKKYSEANKVNLKKIEEEKRKELDRMSKDCEATKSELSTSLQVIDGYRKELELVYADTGGDGSTNTTSNDKDREAEQALYISNLVETIDQKEYEIRMLFKEVDASNRREESLREKVDILSAEKVHQQQRRPGERRAEDSFDDLSSTIDEEMLKTESSKIVNSSPKVSPSVVENSNASPTRRFGLFGRNNDSNNSNNNNKKNLSGGDRVGSNIASSPLSAFAKDANEALLTPPISATTPPTPQNVGNSVTKRTNVLPSEMKEMQQKVQELVAKVDGATTPQGITNALRELEELQQKLSGIEFTTDSPSPLSSSTKDEMMATPPSTTSFNVNMSPSPPRSTRKSNGKQQHIRSMDDANKSANVTPAPVVAAERSPVSSSSKPSTKETTLVEPWLGKSPTGKIEPLKKCTACRTGFPEPGKQFCIHCLTPPNKRGIDHGNNTTTPPPEALEKKKKKMNMLKMFSPKGKK